MSSPTRRLAAWLAGTTLLYASCATEPQPGGEAECPVRTEAPRGTDMAFTFRWENDALAGKDENYSNGISLSLTRRGRGLIGKFWDLFGETECEHFVSYEVGQVILTPQDITLPVPDPADQPYAGVMYLSWSTQIRHDNVFNGLKLVTGVVGPYALGDETQTWFHELTDSDIPQGWDFQLHNEPILNLVYEHRQKFPLFTDPSGFRIEVIPLAEAMLGNMFIQGRVAAQVRVGINVPGDCGTTLLLGFGNLPLPIAPDTGASTPDVGGYLFAGAGGTLVGRNLSLDGNTFRDSPSVEKEPFYPGFEVGASLWTRWFQATIAFVVWGEQFKSEPSNEEFGVLTLTWFF